MPIDLEQFHQAFFEESFEGLETMESGLLNLDPGRVDVKSINTIFRAAHSIKGGSGTFGFTRIAEFTHGVETLLDEVRGERREITREFVDLLLQSVDCLREMLSFTKTRQPIETERVVQTQYRLDQLLHGAIPQNAQSSTAEQSVETESAGVGWHIKFRPHLNLFRTGNDPFRLIRELDALGKLSVRADSTQLPTFAEIDP
jgi:two-component system chemotaxis sensor kinase CheA